MEDEAEVDRLVSEFDGVVMGENMVIDENVMDEHMMENDDLLVDGPGFDAEKIDAISQLSPMQTQYEPAEAIGTKEQPINDFAKAQGPDKGAKKHAISSQNRMKSSAQTLTTDTGLTKKEIY